MDDLRRLGAKEDIAVIVAEEAGLDGDAMEAEAWAYLAVRSMEGLPLDFSGHHGRYETGHRRRLQSGICCSITV